MFFLLICIFGGLNLNSKFMHLFNQSKLIYLLFSSNKCTSVTESNDISQNCCICSWKFLLIIVEKYSWRNMHIQEESKQLISIKKNFIFPLGPSSGTSSSWAH